MFYNRVLPLPPALTSTSVDKSTSSAPNTLLQHKIMTVAELDGNTDTHRSISPRSYRRASSPAKDKRPTSPGQESLEDHEDSLSTESLSSRTTRKRSSSQASQEGRPRSTRGPPSISTLTANRVLRAADSASQVCLCQPDPKVPRPRNAFILYRQHHQVAVVAQNPGLANPEISKIIGDHWRSSPLEIKNHWKSLAEEEKARHQRQYPDYRYQPRRNGRSNSIANTLHSNAVPDSPETPRCPKCGGRSITTPGLSTPNWSTPATPMTPYTPSLPPQTPVTSSSAGRSLPGMGSPPRQQTTSFRSRPPMTSGIGVGPLQLNSLQNSQREDIELPLSPDAKRRRFVNSSYAPVRLGSGSLTPFPFSHRRESLPRPEFMSNSQITMAAPPRPHHSGSAHPDPSLILPPLQTTTAAEASAQAKSVEAMIMSIPHINKVKVLAKISPPLGLPGPTSPVQQLRGSVIAIDGTDNEAIKTVTNYLSEFLTKDSEHVLRTWESPAFSIPKSGATLAQYLDLITYWHATSSEIIRYITTMPIQFSPPPPSSPSPVSPKTTPQAHNRPSSTDSDHDKNESIDKTAYRHSTRPSLSLHTRPVSPRSLALTKRSIPVAILPYYQLSLTDAAASMIPITDAYAPVDHWQWMATLWRGIVGPDITVLIKSADDYKNGTLSPKEEGLRTAPGVEVRLADARAVVVRINEDGKVSEGGLRRLGFEVGEWVRNLGGQDGRRSS